MPKKKFNGPARRALSESQKRQIFAADSLCINAKAKLGDLVQAQAQNFRDMTAQLTNLEVLQAQRIAVINAIGAAMGIDLVNENWTIVFETMEFVRLPQEKTKPQEKTAEEQKATA